jgi:hypothetical protein
MADFHYSQFILKLNIKIEMTLIKRILSIARTIRCVITDTKLFSLWYSSRGDNLEVVKGIYKIIEDIAKRARSG